MPLVLVTFAGGDLDYVNKLNSNGAATVAFVNALEAQILASVGPGSQLILDLWDRDGIVGAHSYVLDIENYAGSALITIGRRPVFDVVKGEVDTSVAFATFAGVKERVFLNADLVLNAAAITTGLPKDIFVGIPSSGTPQLFNDMVTPNVLYIYSMCWNGFSLSDFKRIAHILPAYPTLQAIAAAPRDVSIHDGETNWVSDIASEVEVVLHGAKEDNEIGINGAVEVLGFFVSATKSGDDGWNAPFPGANPDDTVVKMKVTSEGLDWTLTPFEIDAGAVPDQVYRAINPAVVGDKRFVTTIRTFKLERTALGPNVTSARSFIFGVIVKPIIGIAIPRDTVKVLDI